MMVKRPRSVLLRAVALALRDGGLEVEWDDDASFDDDTTTLHVKRLVLTVPAGRPTTICCTYTVPTRQSVDAYSQCTYFTIDLAKPGSLEEMVRLVQEFKHPVYVG